MSRRVRGLLVPALLTAALAFTTNVITAAERVFDRTFTVAPGGLLTIEADATDVTVLGSDSNQVVVHATVEGSQKLIEAMTVKAWQSEGDVTVELVRADGRRWFDRSSWNTSGAIRVSVPLRYGVELRTSGGHVRLENVAGPVHILTSGGSIVAKNVKGNVEAQTSGGDVRLLSIDGRIHATTSGGSVQCDLVGANRGIHATTSGGSIHLTMAKDINGILDAATSGGEVSTDIPVTSAGREPHFRLKGRINGGGEVIYARTSGGGIALRAGR